MGAHFQEEKPQGFLWYNEHPALVKKEGLKIKEQDQTPEGRNEAIKRSFEEAVQKLLDQPTVENAIQAQRIQKVIMDRSEEVSQAWVLAALLDTGLLKKQDNPNVLHRELYEQEKEEQDDQVLRHLGKSWGLLFYVQPRCIYCTRFLPIIEELQKKYGFQVLAISEEGQAYGPFPGGKDTGLLKHFNPEGLAPMLYMVDQKGSHIYPIARGLTSQAKIKQNILLIDQKIKGEIR